MSEVEKTKDGEKKEKQDRQKRTKRWPPNQWKNVGWMILLCVLASVFPINMYKLMDLLGF